MCKPMSPGAIVLAWNGEAPEVGKSPFHLGDIGIIANENCLMHYFFVYCRLPRTLQRQHCQML